MSTVATIIGAIWLAILLIVVVLLGVVLLVERVARGRQPWIAEDPWNSAYSDTRPWAQVEAELSRAAYRETMAAKSKLRIIEGGKE
jgi:hypothetical protein